MARKRVFYEPKVRKTYELPRSLSERLDVFRGEIDEVKVVRAAIEEKIAREEEKAQQSA